MQADEQCTYLLALLQEQDQLFGEEIALAQFLAYRIPARAQTSRNDRPFFSTQLRHGTPRVSSFPLTHESVKELTAGLALRKSIGIYGYRSASLPPVLGRGSR